MDWIFGGFLAASVIHMAEEYFYPGGFMQMMKRLNPGFAPFITVPMAVVVNGLQVVLCVLAVMVGIRAPVFSMSVAGLVFINGLVHIGASLRVRGYAPGVLSGALLYIPLAAYAYAVFISAGQLAWGQVLWTAALGLLYQAVPIAYLAVAKRLLRD